MSASMEFILNSNKEKRVDLVFFILGNTGTLGHFNAIYSVSKQLAKKEVGVAIVSDEDFSKLITEENIEFVQLKGMKIKDIKGFEIIGKYEEIVTQWINDLNPIAVIFESFFNESFIKKISKRIKKGLLVTSFTKESLKLFLVKSFQKYFDFIFLPDDIDHTNGKLVQKLNKSLKTKKFLMLKPLIKNFYKSEIANIKKKYSIASNDFVVLATLGGGGFKINERTEAEKWSPFLANIFNDLEERCKKIKSIIITGPFSGVDEFQKGRLMVKKYEKNFLELLYICDLVVCQAGYNIINEIAWMRKSAIMIPAKRGSSDNQFRRARKMKSTGKNIIQMKLNRQNMLEEIERFYNQKARNKKIKDNTIEKVGKESGVSEIVDFLINL